MLYMLITTLNQPTKCCLYMLNGLELWGFPFQHRGMMVKTS
jgi:hypothetical protein